MNVTITWQIFAWACGLVGGWTAILFAALRWSLSRNLKNFEDKLTATSSDAAQALSGVSELGNKLSNVPICCNGHNGQVNRLDAHNDRLAQHKELLTAIEGDLKHLPRSADIEKLHEKVNKVSNQMFELKSDISKIAGAMPGIIHITEMMNEYLLNNGGKK